MKKIKKYFFTTKSYTLYLIALVVAILYGVIVRPFLLHFIDGLTYVSVIYLAIGIAQWAKDTALFVTHFPKKDKDVKRNIKTEEISIYIPVGFFILVISLAISVLFY